MQPVGEQQITHLENFVLRDERLVLVEELLYALLGAVLAGPVLELALRQLQEGDDAALVLQVLELDQPHLTLGPDVGEAVHQAADLISGHLLDQVRSDAGRLLLDRVPLAEKGAVIVDLLRQHGRRLLVQLGGNVVGVDERLPTIQPLADL